MLTGLNFPISADNRTRRAFNTVTDDLRGIRGALAGVGDYARRTGRAMRSIGTGMIDAVTRPMLGAAAAIDRSTQSLEQLQARARGAGLASQDLVEMELAAARFGIEGDQVADILRDVNDRVGDFMTTGGGPMLDFFEEIAPLVGRTIEDFEGLSSIDALSLIVSDMEAAGLGMQEMTFFMEALASDSTLLLPVLRDNAAELDHVRAMAERLGLAIDDDLIDGSSRARTEMDALRRILGLQVQQTLADLMPVLLDLSRDFMGLVGHVRDGLQWFRDLSPELRQNIVVIAGLAAAIGPLVAGLGLVVMGLSALASPLGLVIFGLGAAAGAAAYLWSQWDELRDRFPILQRLEDLGGALARAWSNLPSLRWVALIPALRWARFIPGLRWAAFIPTLAWATLLAPLRWAALIPRLSWAALGVIGRIGWAALAGALSWATLVPRLAWGALGFIGPIGWVALAGALAWGLLVEEITWDGWIPRITWADWIPEINWSNFIPAIDWASIFRPGELARQRAAAQAAGAAIGSDLAAGATLGLVNNQEGSEQAARDFINAMEGAARDESETQSPSRAWMRIGQDLAEGLGIGVQQGAPQAVEAARGMAAAVTEAGTDATAQLSSFASGFASFVGPIIKGTQSIGDAFRAMASRVANSWINSGLNHIGSLLGQALGIGGGGGGGIFGALFGGGMFADGGVFEHGRVQAFANGGVVSGATAFPMRNGMGLMGEAGPEAILPLARGSNGALGVQVAGSPGGGMGPASELRVSVEVLETGNIRAVARNEAGQVLAESAPQILQEAAALGTRQTFARMRRTKMDGQF